MATMIGALHDGNATMGVHEIEKPVPGPGDAIIRLRAIAERRSRKFELLYGPAPRAGGFYERL